MANDYKTEQEKFWAGEFGDNYINRNMDEKQLASYIHKWSTILNRVGEINTCFEIGSNIGLNFMALGALFPHMEMCGVEINKKAAEECNKLKRVTVYNQSVLDFNTEKKFDLVFSSGF